LTRGVGWRLGAFADHRLLRAGAVDFFAPSRLDLRALPERVNLVLTHRPESLALPPAFPPRAP
jgi:hypothetical protein